MSSIWGSSAQRRAAVATESYPRRSRLAALPTESRLRRQLLCARRGCRRRRQSPGQKFVQVSVIDGADSPILARHSKEKQVEWPANQERQIVAILSIGMMVAEA